jgi:N utilization substance protein A
MEVPEIYEGSVVVKNAVREPGDRAKVAVYSKDKDIDPVGACVGIKGSRVQNIIRELRGEKIDIVEWNEDPHNFAINALNPAKVSRVSVVDEKDKVMEVIVEDKQLSLAIGKRGQNVRLAARLIGWRIDIKSEEEKKREVEDQMTAMASPYTDIADLKGIGEKTLTKLREYGFSSIEQVAATEPEAVTQVPGVGLKTAEKVVATAIEYLSVQAAGAVAVRAEPAEDEEEADESVRGNEERDGSGGEG